MKNSLTFSRVLRAPSIVAAIALPIILGASDQAKAAETLERAEVPGRDWLMVRGDALGTGVARSTLPENLDKLWQFNVPMGAFSATPIVYDGTVFIGDLDGTVWAIDLANGKQRWKFKPPESDGFKASAGYRDGFVCVGDLGGVFYCLDAATGKKLWSRKAEGAIDGSPAFYKRRVIFGSEDNNLYCVDLKTGKDVWKLTLPDQIQCTPAVLDNQAFLAGCDGSFHVVDLDKGTEVPPPVDIEGPSGQCPAIVGDTAYFGTEAGTFFAIDWKKRAVLWRWENAAHAELIASCAALADEVIFASHDRHVRAVDAKGKVLWAYPTHGRIDSSPVIVGDRVFFGSADGRIYALDRTSGKKVWEYEAGGSFSGGAAVASSRLLIASDDGIVYCLGAKQ
jgi:outer membrane protein assembly factor BamB